VRGELAALQDSRSAEANIDNSFAAFEHAALCVRGLRLTKSCIRVPRNVSRAAMVAARTAANEFAA
jgi:hypothetical protein